MSVCTQTELQPAAQTLAALRGRPLYTIRGAVSALNRGEEAVVLAVETGALFWAWNFALNPQRSACREIRILPLSVDAFLAGESGNVEFDEALKSLLPPDEDVLAGTYLQHCCNVSATHLYGLVRCGLLRAVSRPGRGPCGTARILTSSFIAFLKGRRCF